VIDKYELFEGTNRKGPGINIITHYERDAAFARQDFFKLDKLRWLQLLSCSDDVGLLTPRPNRPFIDLRKGQLAPGHPNGEGDDLPFYDFSYPSLADARNNTNIKIDGSGTYLRDDPRAQIGQRSIRFDFQTLVVGIIEDQLLATIGGFSWGFDVAADGKLTAVPIEGLKDDVIALGRFDAMNTALRKDFTGWGLPSQKSYDKPDQYYFGLRVVPEPLSCALFAAGLALLVRSRRVDRR